MPLPRWVLGSHCPCVVLRAISCRSTNSVIWPCFCSCFLQRLFCVLARPCTHCFSRLSCSRFYCFCSTWLAQQIASQSLAVFAILLCLVFVPVCTGCGGGASESGPAAACGGCRCVVRFTVLLLVVCVWLFGFRAAVVVSHDLFPVRLAGALCGLPVVQFVLLNFLLSLPRFLLLRRSAAHGAGDSRLRKGQSTHVDRTQPTLCVTAHFPGWCVQTATQEIEKRKQAAEVRLGCFCVLHHVLRVCP